MKYSVLSASALLGFVLTFGLAPTGSGQSLDAVNPGTPWPATDALGRALPLADTVGPVRTDRFVGIFYFLTHAAGGRWRNHTNGPYDVSKIMAQDPHALEKPDSPLWGPVHSSAYWANHFMATIAAPTRGSCGGTPNCWPTPALTP